MARHHEIRQAWRRVDARPGDALVHPHELTSELHKNRGLLTRISEAVINRVVAVAGTAYFFWFLAVLLFVWPASMSVGVLSFDPFPFAFLFFILGGIMQSLFVPAVMITQKQAEDRDAIKAESDHQAALALRKINDTQLEILQELRKDRDARAN